MADLVPIMQTFNGSFKQLAVALDKADGKQDGKVQNDAEKVLKNLVTTPALRELFNKALGGKMQINYGSIGNDQNKLDHDLATQSWKKLSNEIRQLPKTEEKPQVKQAPIEVSNKALEAEVTNLTPIPTNLERLAQTGKEIKQLLGDGGTAILGLMVNHVKTEGMTGEAAANLAKRP